MPRKAKAILKKQGLKLPQPKQTTEAKKPAFKYSIPLRPILPQLLIIGVCIGLYYAMIYFYIFFQWGFYLYYALKAIVAFELLSASRQSFWVPLVASALASAVLFTHSLYLNTLMNTDTAWQLITVALIGFFIFFYRGRVSHDVK